MTQTTKPNLPIGYWLKRTDETITAGINQAHGVYGITRTHWQALNMLHESGCATIEQIDEVMRTFVDQAVLDRTILDLIERGWLVRDAPGDQIRLTVDGEATHSAILARQKEVRQKAMQGVSDEDYAIVIRVLQRMVSNLQDNDYAPVASTI